MISRVWLINGVLAIALAVCLMNIWDVWHPVKPVFPGKKAVESNKKKIQRKKFPEKRLLNASSYQDVVEKNLFSPDRAPAPASEEKADPQPAAQEIRISGEKVVLYGVVMIDDYKKALINNPGDRKIGQTTQWVSEGDQLKNLTVRKIMEDEILLVDGGNSYRVLLYDPKKKSMPGGSGAARGQEGSQPNVVIAGDKPASKEKKVSRPNQPVDNVTISEDDQYEIVDTPFGKMRRKRK